jgi:LL-diaminopimelate aminotransferase
LAGADVVPLPLLEENNFFPDLGAVSQKAARRAKLLFLNYPNNPTAATATNEQLQEAIAFAKEFGCAVAHDAAYSEIAFDGAKPASFLQLPEAKAVGVEFHSLSKTYNMTGWRVGFVCGNAALIAALNQVKSHIDSGIFQPVQWAGIEALEGDQAGLAQTVATYQARRDLLVDGLAKTGWTVPRPAASFYVWSRVPGGGSSIEFAARVLKEAHVVITPGVGFGPSGEGYVRLSLTVPTARIEEAVVRVSKML